MLQQRELSEDDIKLAIFRWLEGYCEVDGSDPNQIFRVEFKDTRPMNHFVTNIKAKVRYGKRCKRCHKPLTKTVKDKYMCCNQSCPSISGGAK